MHVHLQQDRSDDGALAAPRGLFMSSHACVCNVFVGGRGVCVYVEGGGVALFLS